MRSVTAATAPIIAQRSVRLYKAHRSLYTRFDDRFIVQASREASKPLLRAYTTFVVFGVLLVRSDNLQGCAAPCSIRHLLYSPSGQLGISIFGSWRNETRMSLLRIRAASVCRCVLRTCSWRRYPQLSATVALYPTIGFQEVNNCGAFQPRNFHPRSFYRWPTKTPFLNFYEDMQASDIRQRKTYACLPWDVLSTYVIIFHEIFSFVEYNYVLGNDAGFCQHHMSNIFDIF